MIETRTVNVGDVEIGGLAPFVLITGPCQLESLEHARMMAEKIAEACAPTGTKFIFKASYDKANRSSIGTQRGLGMEEGLKILSHIKQEFGVPVLTDVHDAAQCAPAAEVCDVLQIPAFLCRQTDLLLAAGSTGAAINIKKRPIPGTLGHGQRCSEDRLDRQRAYHAMRPRYLLRLQHLGVRLPWVADHGEYRISGSVRRHSLGAATGGARHDLWRAA